MSLDIDRIFSLAERAGIQKGIDGAWIALEDELIDFARLIEATNQGQENGTARSTTAG